VCDVLGLDAAHLRRGLEQWRSRHGTPIGESRPICFASDTEHPQPQSRKPREPVRSSNDTDFVIALPYEFPRKAA
jgi:hypothetical protein